MYPHVEPDDIADCHGPSSERRIAGGTERSCGSAQTRHLPGNRQVLSVIQGDAVPQKFIPKLIKFYQAGRFPFDRLVKFYAFTQINRAIADSKRGSTIKPVLLISQEATAP